MRKRTRLAVIALAAVLGVSALGVAWAVFSETVVASATGGKGENLAAVQPLSYAYVYDTGHAGLFPGRNADTRIQVKNPNTVDVTVTSVVPDSPASSSKTVTAASGVAADSTYCSNKLTVSTTSPTDFTIEGRSDHVIPAGESVVLIIPNSVALDISADNRCEGMDFTTHWDIAISNN